MCHASSIDLAMTAKTPKAKRSAKSKTPKSTEQPKAKKPKAAKSQKPAETQEPKADESQEQETAREPEQMAASEQVEPAAREPEPSPAAAAEQSPEAKKDENPVGSATSIAHARTTDIAERRQIMETVAQRLAEGESLREICRSPGMPSRYTVLRWAGEDAEIFNLYRTGLAMRAERYAEESVELADQARGRSNEEVQAIKLMVNTRQWVASRLLPKLYGDHQTIEHTGQVQMAPDQVDQRLAVLLRKMQAVDVKS